MSIYPTVHITQLRKNVHFKWKKNSSERPGCWPFVRRPSSSTPWRLGCMESNNHWDLRPVTVYSLTALRQQNGSCRKAYVVTRRMKHFLRHFILHDTTKCTMCSVWCWDMDIDPSGQKKAIGFWNVGLEGMDKIRCMDWQGIEWWSAAECPRELEHLGHSTAVQTEMDRTHPEAWFTATGHNGGQDVGQSSNERMKAPANAPRRHKWRWRGFEEICRRKKQLAE